MVRKVLLVAFVLTSLFFVSPPYDGTIQPLGGGNAYTGS